jgi:hypothetical protein
MADDSQSPFVAEVRCDYCNELADLLLDSSPLYHGIDYGAVWYCRPCKAWVGVHKNSPRFMPLGRLANAELRAAKQVAHSVFDPLWEAKQRRDNCKKHEARGAAYRWLAAQMNIPVEECHIGMFDVQQCLTATRICRSIGKKGEGK